MYLREFSGCWRAHGAYSKRFSAPFPRRPASCTSKDVRCLRIDGKALALGGRAEAVVDVDDEVDRLEGLARLGGLDGYMRRC